MILEQAAELLATSPSGDVSTRAVCEAAGVTQPVLYRLFGDKDGLLTAVADHVWEQYLDGKRRAEESDDPLEDLRAGWDNHTAFALTNPHAYRLVFSADLAVRPAAIAEAMRLLVGITERLAAQARLAVAPEVAAQIVMAANSGFALGALLRPEVHTAASIDVREATIRGILADADPTDPLAGAVATIRARVPGNVTSAEAGLLDEWLDRLTKNE